MKKRNLLLGVSLFCLSLAGCGNDTQTSREAELESIINSMNAEKEKESLLESLLNSMSAGNEGNSVVAPSNVETPAEKNLVDMNRVMNLQASSLSSDDARLGSWFCGWEGWPVDIQWTNEVLSVTQPDCFYSGADSWYVQINIPYDSFKLGTTYCLSFDLKGRSTASTDTTIAAPKISSPIDIQFLDATIDSPDARGESAVVIGQIPASVFASYTHFEYTFTNSSVGSKGYLCILLGGRGNLEYYFKNLSLTVVG